MGRTWGLSGADRTQVGPMLSPWTLLSGMFWPNDQYGTYVFKVLRHFENFTATTLHINIAFYKNDFFKIPQSKIAFEKIIIDHINLSKHKKIWLHHACLSRCIMAFSKGSGCDLNCSLDHWGQDEADIKFQTTFSNRFSWMKIMNFDYSYIEVCSQGSN